MTLVDGHALTERSLRYYVLGSGEWKETSTWPVPGNSRTRLYFREGGALSVAAPADSTGSDLYTVDFTARSSPESRWMGPVTGESSYPDRSAEDVKLLYYETDPLPQAIEITGYPAARLFVASSHPDGTFIVYLEDVAPDGTVRYLTEGVLRAIDRRERIDPRPWSPPIPYHSFRSEDAQPLVPGAMAELSTPPCSPWRPSWKLVIESASPSRVTTPAHCNGCLSRVHRGSRSFAKGRQHPGWSSLS